VGRGAAAVNADLAALRAVQARDLAIDALEARVAGLPAAREALARRTAEAEAAVAAARGVMRDAQQLIDRRSLDLSTSEEVRRRLERQLQTLKSNADYQAMQRQIAAKAGEISALETAVLEAMELLDRGRAALAEREEARRRVEELVAAEGRGLDADAARWAEEIEAGRRERERLVALVPRDLRQRYEEARRRHRGLALADVSPEGTCQGCHLTVTPARIAQAGAGELVNCNNCGRFLFVAP
jgi:predicted  nucleic acid-binding Zn-ribbon protein